VPRVGNSVSAKTPGEPELTIGRGSLRGRGAGDRQSTGRPPPPWWRKPSRESICCSSARRAMARCAGSARVRLVHADQRRRPPAARRPPRHSRGTARRGRRPRGVVRMRAGDALENAAVSARNGSNPVRAADGDARQGVTSTTGARREPRLSRSWPLDPVLAAGYCWDGVGSLVGGRVSVVLRWAGRRLTDVGRFGRDYGRVRDRVDALSWLTFTLVLARKRR
jgi:hypothetical protein